MMISKKYIFRIIYATVTLILMTLSFVVARRVYEPELTENKTGSLRVEVVDGLTDSRIEGARVVIPETNQEFITGEDGLTSSISLPVLRDSRYDATLPQEWGGVSILVYCEGYVEYALFYARVTEGEEREPIRIYLFEKGATGSSQPFSVIEGPQRKWVNQMLDKYRPQ